MASDSINEIRVFHETKEPYIFPNDALEWERLDEMHNGIDVYLGHKLSLGPAVENVNKILEIGCGSGAWAIQAAQAYPEATVIAIDISPIPPRPLPPNMQFLQLNTTEPLPFEPESFDIIHARLVFVHLPSWETVLKHVISYLKPQGWLWIEDINMQFFGDGPHGLGPFSKLFNDIYLRYMSARNVDPLVGSSLESVLRKTGSFSEVNCVRLRCPFNGNDNDPSIQLMGRVWYSSLRRAAKGLDPKLIAAGLTTEVMEGVLREAGDPSGNSYWQFYLTWSQKK